MLREVHAQCHAFLSDGLLQAHLLLAADEKSVLPDGFTVDASVDAENNHQWDVERAGTGEENVGEIVVDETDAIDGLHLILPAEKRRDRDEHRHEPGDADGARRSTTRDDQRVAQRTCHADVPFDRDEHQTVDARRAVEHVDRQPDVTEGLTERPLALEDLQRGRERQDGDT